MATKQLPPNPVNQSAEDQRKVSATLLMLYEESRKRAAYGDPFAAEVYQVTAAVALSAQRLVD